MARALTYRYGAQQLSFELGSKVDKRALYGQARRIAEKDGVQLARGVLLADGRLLPSAALSWVRVDPEGSPVEEVQSLVDGQVVEPFPSSFDVESELEALPLTALATFQVQDVYPLMGEGLAEGLYATEFNYRKGPQRKDAMVLVRADQAFLLIGQAKAAAFLDRSVNYAFFDTEAEAEDGDELDFSMI